MNVSVKSIVFVGETPAYLGSPYLIATAFGRLVVDEIVTLVSVSPEGIATVKDGETLSLPFEYLRPVMKAIPQGLYDHLATLVSKTAHPVTFLDHGIDHSRVLHRILSQK